VGQVVQFDPCESPQGSIALCGALIFEGELDSIAGEAKVPRLRLPGAVGWNISLASRQSLTHWSGPLIDDKGELAQHLRSISAEAEFARNEYLQINREQMQLRLIAIGTGGVIASILFPLFSRTVDETLKVGNMLISLADMIGLSLLVLSLFYALLGLVYVDLSGRRSVVVDYLEVEVPKYLKCNGLPVYKSSLGAAGRGEDLSSLIWFFATLCTFVLPAITCVVAAWLVREMLPNYIYLIVTFGVGSLLLATAVRWWRYGRPRAEVWWKRFEGFFQALRFLLVSGIVVTVAILALLAWLYGVDGNQPMRSLPSTVGAGDHGHSNPRFLL
jgi:hypothetical protein